MYQQIRGWIFFAALFSAFAFLTYNVFKSDPGSGTAGPIDKNAEMIRLRLEVLEGTVNALEAWKYEAEQELLTLRKSVTTLKTVGKNKDASAYRPLGDHLRFSDLMSPLAPDWITAAGMRRWSQKGGD